MTTKLPHIITISGPSLSGKTELSKVLQNEYGYNAVISVTTRPIRNQEKDGVDYHFINKEEYDNLSLIQKTHFNNNYYGVSEKEVLSKNNAPIIWVVAPESIDQIEAYCKNNQFNITKVFVTNPEHILFERLFKRFKDDVTANTETYVKRLQSMIGEERQWSINAKNNPEVYDKVIMQFDNHNKQDIIDEVLSLVESKSNQNNNTNKNTKMKF